MIKVKLSGVDTLFVRYAKEDQWQAIHFLSKALDLRKLLLKEMQRETEKAEKAFRLNCW
jgi:hypothetical protein